ncbi:MAG: winged helix-turn-helix transcriptional regulator [Myxococcota bacterium]
MRTDRLHQRVLAVCDAVGAYIEAWGFRSIHGRVWALLAMRKAPLSQIEIAEMLGVSRSLVSLAVSELSSYGLVRASGEHRGAPIEACLDVWPTITDVIRSREWMLIERSRLALEAIIAEVEHRQRQGESTPYDVARIRLLLTMAEFAQTTLRAVLSVRMPGSLEHFGKWLNRAGSFVGRLHDRLPF